MNLGYTSWGTAWSFGDGKPSTLVTRNSHAISRKVDFAEKVAFAVNGVDVMVVRMDAYCVAMPRSGPKER